MKFISPLGRAGAGNVTPRACMCPIEGGFSSTRNDNDSCVHCGCSCSSGGEYRTGNNLAALKTFTTS